MSGLFDFAWPEGLIGRSSSWSDKRSPDQTMLHPPVASRREVKLAARWRALRLAVNEDGEVDAARAEPTRLLIKARPDAPDAVGLSSGAASALIRDAAGGVQRLKRCGYAELGVGPRTGFVGRIGMMSIAEALQECRMLATFRAQGLCPACTPESIEILADPTAPFFKPHAFAAVRVRITSDVRADEWFLLILTRALEAAGLAPPFFTIQDDERIALRAVADALPVLEAAQVLERVARLGRGLGGLMRAVHDAGLLRGRGSVWLGNDVVGPDLRLSAVDADGGARPANSAGGGAMPRIEAAEYAAGFADCYSWGQPDWLAEPATVLCEAFWEGYRSAAAPNVAGSLEV